VKRGVGFTAWNTSLDESMERIHGALVANFDDANTWIWLCWLNATDKGEVIATALREDAARTS
jgi:hypothetical protein